MSAFRSIAALACLAAVAACGQLTGGKEKAAPPEQAEQTAPPEAAGDAGAKPEVTGAKPDAPAPDKPA